MIQKLANYIIRPPRIKYKEEGLDVNEYIIDGCKISREDFNVHWTFKKVVNFRDEIIKTTVYYSENEKEKPDLGVFYCHGNSGNRISVSECLLHLIRKNFLVITFDFTG